MKKKKRGGGSYYLANFSHDNLRQVFPNLLHNTSQLWAHCPICGEGDHLQNLIEKEPKVSALWIWLCYTELHNNELQLAQYKSRKGFYDGF